MPKKKWRSLVSPLPFPTIRLLCTVMLRLLLELQATRQMFTSLCQYYPDTSQKPESLHANPYSNITLDDTLSFILYRLSILSAFKFHNLNTCKTNRFVFLTISVSTLKLCSLQLSH